MWTSAEVVAHDKTQDRYEVKRIAQLNPLIVNYSWYGAETLSQWNPMVQLEFRFPDAVCECGADKAGQPGHAPYCPKGKR